MGTTPGRSDDADERNDDHEGDDVVLALARTRARDNRGRNHGKLHISRFTLRQTH